MSEQRRKRWLVVVVLSVFVGCWAQRSGPAPVDAGAGGDGDAGPTLDAGRREDAGSRFDAGARPDGGTALDAGPELQDAGSPPDVGPPLAQSTLIYPSDRTQSPIDGLLAQRLKDIAARGTGRPGVFARVGDSVSISYDETSSGSSFLNCFDGILEGPVSWDVNIRLGAFSALAPTIAYFKTTPLGTSSSWTRVSVATRVGQTASWPLLGSPSPLHRELAAINPRYAVVLYGSNDIGWGGAQAYPIADQAERYELHMRRLTDLLISRGVVPILNTMPPDGDYFTIAPVFAGVVRAIAQGRQVPLIDLYREFMAMGPPYGLRSDRTHPSQRDYNTSCWFDPASLATYGANVRNLITLASLDRMRQLFDAGAASLDPAAPHLVGDGSTADPFVIGQVPWGELRDLRGSTFTATGSLSCAGAPQVSGPQTLYALVLTRPRSLRVLVLNGGQGGHQVSLLSGPTLSTCVKTDSRLLSASLTAGTYYLSVNALSPTDGSEYNLSITECLAGDPDC